MQAALPSRMQGAAGQLLSVVQVVPRCLQSWLSPKGTAMGQGNRLRIIAHLSQGATVPFQLGQVAPDFPSRRRGSTP
jgi:hypothetical protein